MKFSENEPEQLRTVFAVGQRTVMVAGVEVKKSAQVLQTVTVQAGKCPPGQFQRVEHGGTAPGKTATLNDGREKAEVERRVVQHKRRAGRKLDQAAHNLFGTGGTAHHVTADAVNGGHGARDDTLRIDQRLKGLAPPVGQDLQRGDFDNAAKLRTQARRLDVERRVAGA